MTKLERVCETITRRIETGALREGDRLPSEDKLAAQQGVSVGTVQKALGQLAHAGLVTREHGRGTFVTGSRVRASDVSYLRFRDAEGHEIPNFIHLLSVKRMRSRGPWSDFLGGEPPYVRIERRISVGGLHDLHSAFWLREKEFARLNSPDRRALERNLRVLLGQRLSLPTLRVDQWIRFERLPPVIARELGIERDTPGFVMEMRGYTLRDRPLYFQRVCAGPFTQNLEIVR